MPGSNYPPTNFIPNMGGPGPVFGNDTTYHEEFEEDSFMEG